MFLRHSSCPKCGSKDNLAIYDDGGAYCFSTNCNYYVRSKSDNGYNIGTTMQVELVGVIDSIKDRRISKATCERFNVHVEYDSFGNIAKHHYPYYRVDTGDIAAIKTRVVQSKQFSCKGISQGLGLFGQQICRGSGKFITITEGECDALAVSEMFNNKWDVVSIRTGSQGARKDIQDNLEFLEGYDSVVVCFDNDNAGKAAIESIKDLFSPHKLKIMKLPDGSKDACDLLKDGNVTEFMKCWWDAKAHKPDGIVTFEEIIKEVENEEEDNSILYPWSGLNHLTYGFRPSELVTVTSGSGMGKSQILREMEYYLYTNTQDNIAVIALEEVPKRTGLGIASIMANQPLHLPGVTKDDRLAWLRKINPERFYFWKHFGSADDDSVFSRIRYMAKAYDCKWFILDHISIIVSSQEGFGDERRAIDAIMTKLRTLVQELNIGMFLVSHLRRPQGSKGHEEGAQVSLSELRGSAAIAQLSDCVIGLERNQQAEDLKEANTTVVRVLKNRFAGLTGVACKLFYERDTGRLVEMPDDAAEQNYEVPF